MVNKDFRKADLTGKNFRMADLRGADLREANLSKSNLTEADLREADLQGADLTGADLDGAFLRDANLRGANLTSVTNIFCVDIESAYIDKETKFPASIRIKWKSDRKYVCIEIHDRNKKGRRETGRRVKDKGRLFGNRRESCDRRDEIDRREIQAKKKKPQKGTNKSKT
jgi:uncharacterized protein YlaI